MGKRKQDRKKMSWRPSRHKRAFWRQLAPDGLLLLSFGASGGPDPASQGHCPERSIQPTTNQPRSSEFGLRQRGRACRAVPPSMGAFSTGSLRRWVGICMMCRQKKSGLERMGHCLEWGSSEAHAFQSNYRAFCMRYMHTQGPCIPLIFEAEMGLICQQSCLDKPRDFLLPFSLISLLSRSLVCWAGRSALHSCHSTDPRGFCAVATATAGADWRMHLKQRGGAGLKKGPSAAPAWSNTRPRKHMRWVVTRRWGRRPPHEHPGLA